MTMDNISDTNDSHSLNNTSTCEKLGATSSFQTSIPKSISCKECMNKSEIWPEHLACAVTELSVHY